MLNTSQHFLWAKSDSNEESIHHTPSRIKQSIIYESPTVSNEREEREESEESEESEDDYINSKKEIETASSVTHSQTEKKHQQEIESQHSTSTSATDTPLNDMHRHLSTTSVNKFSSFLQRMKAMEEAKRRELEILREQNKKKDPEATFKPQITPRARSSGRLRQFMDDEDDYESIENNSHSSDGNNSRSNFHRGDNDEGKSDDETETQRKKRIQQRKQIPIEDRLLQFQKIRMQEESERYREMKDLPEQCTFKPSITHYVPPAPPQAPLEMRNVDKLRLQQIKKQQQEEMALLEKKRSTTPGRSVQSSNSQTQNALSKLSSSSSNSLLSNTNVTSTSSTTQHQTPRRIISEVDLCTFHPHITPAAHIQSEETKEYLSKDPFERLSTASSRRPTRRIGTTEVDLLRMKQLMESNGDAPDEQIDFSAMNESNEISSKENERNGNEKEGKVSREDDEQRLSRFSTIFADRPIPKPSSDPLPTSRSATPLTFRSRSSTLPSSSDEHSRHHSKKLSQADFNAFLQRQSDSWSSRRVLELVHSSEVPIQKPALCPKSLELASQRVKEPFLQRVQKEIEAAAAQKAHTARAISLEKEKVELGQNKEAGDGGTLDSDGSTTLFQPHINAVSKKRKRKGFESLSTGEMLKRQAEMEKLIREREMEEKEKMPFTPVRQSRDFGVGSKLELLKSPSTLITRMEEEKKKALEKVEKEIKEKQKEEEAELTFAPKIHDAPEYIKKIAKSIHQMKKLSSANRSVSRGYRR
eukprot:MONOS_392.1-p1 / transcript=MONOS_392.1 / gene=MONOS_392 / organism=Monocercomonoides_exilis_PA203 / gene_product=unspecified product / transcript_product=unspecified product / location=Mono_scaffold00006:200479-202749(+) / protein_length=757 / sequence_SO=supercontig / SO=protein_coding / is_pseudo=false